MKVLYFYVKLYSDAVLITGSSNSVSRYSWVNVCVWQYQYLWKLIIYDTLKWYLMFIYFPYRKFSLFCVQNHSYNTEKAMICVMFVCVVNQ